MISVIVLKKVCLNIWLFVFLSQLKFINMFTIAYIHNFFDDISYPQLYRICSKDNHPLINSEWWGVECKRQVFVGIPQFHIHLHLITKHIIFIVFRISLCNYTSQLITKVAVADWEPSSHLSLFLLFFLVVVKYSLSVC